MRSVVATICLLLWVCLSLWASAAVAADPIDIFECNRRLGRGVNLGNFLEAPRGQNWGVTIKDEHFEAIKRIGFDSIRLPVRWPDYALADAPYTIEPDFFSKVDRLLDLAENVGLNVVLNIHHYESLDQDPQSQRPRFVALWKQIGERYASRPDSLYFELSNEPHDQLSQHWNAILRDALAAVRQSNPSRPVIIGPPDWNGIRTLPELDLPDDPRLIVTVHMYNPFDFTHQGASWAPERVQKIKNLSWGTEAERQALEQEMDQAAEWAKQHNRPMYLGEFGAYSAAPMESRIRWTGAIVRAAEARNMSWAYWEFAAGFGIYDAESARWREPLLRALLPVADQK